MMSKLSCTPEYRAWSSLRARCTNSLNPAYSDYGGRGITVCKRWATFANFLIDMGLRPTPFHSIDRIDNDKGYGPDNCKWSTRLEQSLNKRIRYDNKLGVRGVYFFPNRRKPWLARITINYKLVRLGYYETIEEAAAAYSVARESRLVGANS